MFVFVFFSERLLIMCISFRIRVVASRIFSSEGVGSAVLRGAVGDYAAALRLAACGGGGVAVRVRQRP